MAAVTRVKARPVTPAAYEFNQDATQAAAALVAGTLVTISAATPAAGFHRVVEAATIASAGTNAKVYMVLMDAKAGGGVNLGNHGEIDGFSGLTPGAPLYQSAAVAGGIDNAKPVGAVERMWAISATRIYFNL